MLIDWFTVIAQALNFLILVWLLKRFAYQPILQAINLREQRIAEQVAAAAAAEAAASAERETLGRRSAELDQHRAALLDQITQEAAATRSRLLEQVRQEADAQRTRLFAALGVEQAALKEDLGNKVHAAVMEILRRSMRDLAHAGLNEMMVGVFLERLGSLGEADRLLLGSAGTGAAPPVVRSAFELTPETRARIQAAVAALPVAAAGVAFEAAADLICGIELQAAGHRLAWSVADYLDDLESGVDRILESQGGSPAAAAAAVPAKIT